jgi:two-component system cell cycle response regulator
MKVERRKHPRIAVVQPATLLRDDGSPIADCVLRDISVGGARLRIEAVAQVPRTFNLQVPRGGKVQRHCELVWQADSEMGVRFLSGGPIVPIGDDSGASRGDVAYL